MEDADLGYRIGTTFLGIPTCTCADDTLLISNNPAEFQAMLDMCCIGIMLTHPSPQQLYSWRQKPTNHQLNGSSVISQSQVLIATHIWV